MHVMTESREDTVSLALAVLDAAKKVNGAVDAEHRATGQITHWALIHDVPLHLVVSVNRAWRVEADRLEGLMLVQEGADLALAGLDVTP